MEELKDQVPFHSLIIGPTNCGKTQYLIDILRGPYRHVFEYVILICPTYSKNKTYQGFGKNDPRFIVLSPDASSVDEIDEILSCCKEVFSGHETLIVLDDCAVSKDLKQRSNMFINLAFSGRHEKISVWVLTQQLTSIAKPYRENIACVISFFSPSRISKQILFDEYGGDLSVEHKKEFMKILKNNKYAHVCFCLMYPYYQYVIYR